MRKELKKIYEKSEGIICTGHSFLFLFDIEKAKYKEVFVPIEDWEDCPCLMMHATEMDEIVALIKEDGKPLVPGDYERGVLVVHEGTLFGFEEKVLKYRKTKRDSESFSGSGTIPSWELLNKDQKKIINDLVKEFVKLNA